MKECTCFQVSVKSSFNYKNNLILKITKEEMEFFLLESLPIRNENST